MNAPNPSSADRDLEALRRAQRAHEPSMEEILASIRSIIADDREAPAASPPAQKPSAAAGPQIVYSNDSPPSARSPAPALAPEPAPLAPTPAAPPPEPAAIVASAPKIVWEKAPPVPEPAAAPASEPSPVVVAEEPFASPATEAAVAASFEALSATVAMQSAEMIEGMMHEMLRPMLKSWLDDNLPSLVERLVRAEIQRVARGAR
jgi:cell pole-organizing protein PopZ